MSKKIFWIASWPRSGNTWMRAIISSIFFTKSGKFDFSLLKKIQYFDVPEAYEFVKKININDYKKINKISVLSKYRIEAQKKIKIAYGAFSFFKTHSSNLEVKNFKYTNESNTLGLIYLVRDPRDIAVSYAFHQKRQIDDVINYMIRQEPPNLISKTSNKSNAIPMHISRWDKNYISWLELDVPKLIIKYETLLSDNLDTLKKIINFFEQNYKFSFENKKQLIKNIAQTTSFKKLKKTQDESGFPYSKNKNFFRKGIASDYKKELNKSQISKIEESFGKTMKLLGYL